MSKRAFLLVSSLMIVWAGCTRRTMEVSQQVDHDPVDSLTGVYLELQDSMWMAWHKLVQDESQRINSMSAAVDHLMGHNNFGGTEIASLQNHMIQLSGITISARTMADKNVVHEYDQACKALMSELERIREQYPQFKNDSNCQRICSVLHHTEAQANLYRRRYDSLAVEFNQFLVRHQDLMKEIDPDCPLVERPVLQANRP